MQESPEPRVVEVRLGWWGRIWQRLPLFLLPLLGLEVLATVLLAPRVGGTVEQAFSYPDFIMIGLPTILGVSFLLAWVFALEGCAASVRVSVRGLALEYGWPRSFTMETSWDGWRPKAAFWPANAVFFQYLEGKELYEVTIRQARAILSHPACPHWELPSDVRRWCSPT